MFENGACKQEEKLQAMKNYGRTKRLPGAGRPFKCENLEEELSEWICDRRARSLRVSRKMIQWKAKEFFQKTPASEKRDLNFSASDGLLHGFIKRNHLSLRRRTSVAQKLPHDVKEKIVRYLLYVEGLRKNCVYRSSAIGAADEINYVSPKIYDIIADCPDYNDALCTLESMFVKSPNEIFARHLLATRSQHSGDSLDEFLLSLKILSKDCNFKAVDANAHRDESIRDAFITGLRSSAIRQRLLENKTLELTSAIDQARALDTAIKHSEMYSVPPMTTFSASSQETKTDCADSNLANCAAATSNLTGNVIFADTHDIHDRDVLRATPRATDIARKDTLLEYVNRYRQIPHLRQLLLY